jgi:hypothetical protein
MAWLCIGNLGSSLVEARAYSPVRNIFTDFSGRAARSPSTRWCLPASDPKKPAAFTMRRKTTTHPLGGGTGASERVWRPEWVRLLFELRSDLIWQRYPGW